MKKITVVILVVLAVVISGGVFVVWDLGLFGKVQPEDSFLSKLLPQGSVPVQNASNADVYNVGLRDTASLAEGRAIVVKLGGEVLDELPLSHLLIVRLTDTQKVSLTTHPDVLWVEKEQQRQQLSTSPSIFPIFFNTAYAETNEPVKLFIVDHGDHYNKVADSALDVIAKTGANVKVYATTDLGTNGRFNDATAGEGIRKAVDLGANVINVSSGCAESSGSKCLTMSDPLKKALDYANSRGVIVVTAAGNKAGFVDQQSFQPGVISVGGLYYPEQGGIAADQKLSGNTTDTQVAFYALPYSPDGSYGTSFSSPRMAAQVAVIQSKPVGAYDTNGDGKWDINEVTVALNDKAKTDVTFASGETLFASASDTAASPSTRPTPQTSPTAPVVASNPSPAFAAPSGNAPGTFVSSDGQTIEGTIIEPGPDGTIYSNPSYANNSLDNSFGDFPAGTGSTLDNTYGDFETDANGNPIGDQSSLYDKSENDSIGGGGVLGCQGATAGGSLGNALVGGLLNRLPGNVSAALPGTTRAVNRAVGAVPGISGAVAANSAGGAVSDALGGGALGNAAGNVAGNLAGNVAHDIAGNIIYGGGSGTLGSLNLSNLGSGLTNSLDRLGNRVAGSLTNALVSLPGFAGDIAANSAGNAVNDALGGGFLGNIAGSIAGDIAGNLANDIGNNLVGGALGSLGGGALGSLGGGVLGSLGGGVLGSLGGGNVPVSDATAQKIQRAINTDTRGIYGDTASLVRKECITDPLTRRIAQRTRLSITKSIVDRVNTGLNGGSYPIQPGYTAQAYSSVNTQFIQSAELNAISPAYRSQVREQLANNFQSETDFQSRIGCSLKNPRDFLQNGTPQNGLGFWGTWKIAMVEEPGCTPSGAVLIAENERVARAQAKVEQVQTYAEQGNGYLPETECLDKSGTTILDCQNFRVVTPGSLVRTEYEGAITSGERDLEQTRETGEVIDTLFAQLGQVALTSFSGSLGLSRKKSTGAGSYLDQVTGKSTAASFAQTRNIVSGDIEAALVVHAIYQSILEEILTNVKTTAGAYEGVRACYATLGSSVSISPTVVTERTNIASTTVLILTPKIIKKTNELARAQRTGLELQTLLTQAGQAQSTREVNMVTTAFDTLSAEGTLYNTTDATFLANDRDSSAVTLAVLQADAAIQLEECKKF